jgi:integrase
MPRKTAPLHVKVVWSRGREYHYFRLPKGVLKRLPSPNDPDYGRHYAECMAALTRSLKARTLPTVADAIRGYEADPKYTKRASSTQFTYLIYLNRLRELMGKAPVSDVKRIDIRRMMDNSAKTPGAANMMLTVASNVFRWAKARDMIGVNPCDGIEPFEAPEHGDHKPWPEPMIERALSDPKVKLSTALLYFTAQRIGDVCKMRWDQISTGDDGKREIEVNQEKTGKVLTIPLHSRLIAILADAPRQGDTILTGPKGRAAKTQTVRAHLQAFAQANGGTRNPHGLRKNAVIALLDQGCEVGEVQAISGQTLAVIEHYAKRRNTRYSGRRAMKKWDGNE